MNKHFGYYLNLFIEDNIDNFIGDHLFRPLKEQAILKLKKNQHD